MPRITQLQYGGENFALLIEDDVVGPFLVGPIVFGLDGKVAEGLQVLLTLAIHNPDLPVVTLRGRSPADIAEIDRRMAHLSQELGVPSWRRKFPHWG